MGWWLSSFLILQASLNYTAQLPSAVSLQMGKLRLETERESGRAKGGLRGFRLPCLAPHPEEHIIKIKFLVNAASERRPSSLRLSI